jgi:hypothetical protein
VLHHARCNNALPTQLIPTIIDFVVDNTNNYDDEDNKDYVGFHYVEQVMAWKEVTMCRFKI